MRSIFYCFFIAFLSVLGFGYCTAAISEAERCGYNTTQTRFHPDNGYRQLGSV